MEEIRTLGFKQGEAQAPAGDGQPENKESTAVSELESEAEKLKVVEEDDQDAFKPIEEDDEKVVLPKDQFEKLKSDRQIYKDGLLGLKGKIKEVKAKATVEQPTKTDQGAEKKQEDGGDAPLTRGELNQLEEQKALKEIEQDQFNDEHFAEILPFYKAPQKDKLVIAGELTEAWKDARAAFIARNPDKAPKETDADKRSILGVERAPQVGKGPDGKAAQEQKGGVLPKKTPVQEWYR